MPTDPPQSGLSRLSLGLAVLALLFALLPPFAAFLESRLYTHVLGQYALLVVGGALFGALVARRAPRGRWLAGPALLMAVFALAFWLLPRSIDASLSEPLAMVLKPLTLVGLAGLPLGFGWALASPVLRGFLVTSAISMFGVMGWLQLAVPQRLCNAYLLTDQETLGKGFLLLALFLLLGGLVYVMTPAAAKPAARR